MILYGHSTDNSAKIFSKVVFSHVDNYLQTTNDDTPLQPLDGFTFDLQRFDFSGSGTETDPYKISTAADLQQLATDVNGGNTYSGIYFKVTANIDLSELGEDYSWTAIGTSSKVFAGTFDGGSSEGYKISNLSHSSTNKSYVGLFGNVSGTIKNVTLETVNISITASSSNMGENVGGLVGCNDGGTIENVTLENVNINLKSALIGKSTCNNVGGLVGFNVDGTVTGTVDNGTVNGGEKGTDIGGLVGINVDGTVTDSTVSGYNHVGGFAGYNGGTINSGTVGVGEVTGSSKVGGFVGVNNGGTVGVGDNTCTASGTVTGNEGSSQVGGFVGTNSGTINSPGFYYSEFANGSTNSNEGFEKLYCLTVNVSGDNVTVKISENDYFLKDGNNYYVKKDATVNITADGYTMTFDHDGEGIDDDGTDGTYSMSEDRNAVITLTAIANEPWDGSGTESNPYLITSVEDLQTLATKVNEGNNYSGKCFRLTNDLNLSGVSNWTPIGTDINHSFQGTADGGTSITTVSGTGEVVGALVGDNSGSASNNKFYSTNLTDIGEINGGTGSDNTRYYKVTLEEGVKVSITGDNHNRRHQHLLRGGRCYIVGNTGLQIWHE